MLAVYIFCMAGTLQYAVRASETQYIEIPTDPKIVYIEREVEKKSEINPHYESIASVITKAEIDMLAKLIYLEARGESVLGQRAVCEVVFNRMLDSRFPDTVSEVVYQNNPTQFSPAYKIKDTTATEEQYEVIRITLEETTPLLESKVVFFSTGTNGYKIYEKIGAHYFCY